MKPQRLVYRPTRSRRLNEMLGLVVLVAAGLLLLALTTYTPSDPSFNTVGGTALAARVTGVVRPAHNWTGLIGAYAADLLLQWIGVAIVLLPVMMLRVGVSWMRSRAVGAALPKAAGLLLWLVAAPAAVALLPGHALWRHALPLEGVEGRLFADGLVHFVNVPGAVILLSLMVAISLYLATTFTLHSGRDWFASHFAFAGNLRDQYQGWKQRRLERKEEGKYDAPPSTRQQPAETAADGDAPAHSSLLQTVMGWFGRGKRDDDLSLAPKGTWAADDDGEPKSVWETMPRTVGAATAATALATAAAAAAPYAQALAAAAQPVRIEGETLFAEPDFHEEQTGSFSASEPQATPHVPHFDDDWLNAPERNVPASVFAEPIAAATPMAVPMATPPLAEIDIPEPPPARLPAPMPAPLQMPAPRAARPAPVPPPMPTPMQPIADQNISFGRRADADQISVAISPKSIRGYKLPPSSLLYRSEEQAVAREEELLEEARVLVEKCAEFGVDGTVTQINPGPVVTTFEFKPDSGVKYSRVTGLADDLCLAMAAESILIERMAGKSTVGIQIPNHHRETIWLRDVVECESFAQSKSKLAIALGKDINGRIVTHDLASMPHVLIAGSTGSGKSVAINAMIMSVLYKSTPEQVRMILVDPKRVELGMYEGIPHLFTPIITEAKLAANALRNAVREMERRLKLLAANHVRNIDQFNKLFDAGSEYLFEDVNQEPLPYIMIVIDELADLMMLDRANVEEAITRLAQMARAVGIHLVLATQRPSVDVITGLLKANVPTRMSFRLATKVDSRTIIDSNGAESLLGRGDMLFLPPGTSRLQRVHAPFVTEKEISAVTEFWKAQGEAEYAEGFLEAPKDEKGNTEGGSANDGEENDPLFDEAVRLVFEFGKASTSLLQRRLRVGYGRAAHLIDMMERDGLVGPADGSKPREILKAPSFYAEVDAALR